MLCNRYGDKDKLIDKLQTELFNLHKPVNSAPSLRSFYDQVECICRQLSGMTINVDSNSFVSIAIKGKIPIELKTEMLGKEMDSGTKWSSKQWREALGRAVRLKEAVAASADHSFPPPKAAMPSALPSPKSQEPTRRAFPIIRDSSSQPPDSPGCSLCGEMTHKPSLCPDYPTPESRRNRLFAQKRCFICAQEGHFSNSCTSKRDVLIVMGGIIS